MDDDLRGILEKLSEGMFPLPAWIEEKVKNDRYKPHEHAPWRDKGKSLSVKDTGAVVFFEELLGQGAGEAALADRFAEVIADPLRFSPLLDATRDWRASRRLEHDAKFGIVGSGNVIAAADGTPVTRARFYAPYWDLLRQAVAGVAPASPADWELFAKALMSDASPAWPVNQPLKSSVFMKQLGRDLLQGLLNMRNPAADPWRVAFLEELGEHRRVGNSFTRHDVERFVRAFRERMRAPA
jgi:hypothetical protein